MDISETWKVISIPLTGLFAMIGLVFEVKNKETGKLTKWGMTSLVGVVVSTTGGFTAQWIDNQNNARKSLESKRTQEYLKGQLDVANNQILRVLTPLEGSEIFFEVKFDCIDKRFVKYCSNAIDKGGYGYDIEGDLEQFHYSNLKLNIPMKLSVMHGHKALIHKEDTATEFVYGETQRGTDYTNTNVSLSWEMPEPTLPSGWGATVDCEPNKARDIDRCMLMKGTANVEIDYQDGSIISIPDLKNTTIILSSPDNNFSSAFRAIVKIHTKSGQDVTFDYAKAMVFKDQDGYRQFAWYN